MIEIVGDILQLILLILNCGLVVAIVLNMMVLLYREVRGLVRDINSRGKYKND